MEAQKWVTPSAGCGEEAEVREDDLGFSWGSLSRGCVRSARAGLPRVSCLPLNRPAGVALPRPLPAESPRELRPLRSSRLRPAPSTARAASAPWPAPRAPRQRRVPSGRPTHSTSRRLGTLFTLRSRADKDRKGGAVVVTFLSLGVLPPNHFWSAVPSPAHTSLIPYMSSWNLQSLGGRQSLPGHWFLLPISFRAQLLRAFCVLSPVLEARTIY